MIQPEAGSTLMDAKNQGFFGEDSKKAQDLRDRLAAIGMSWFTMCQSQRIKQERQWYLNLAFYYGNQHVVFRQIPQSGLFDLHIPRAPSWSVRLVVNQVRKIVRKEISRLTAQKPNIYVVPSSTEDADVFAAQAGEQIWESLWRRLHLNRTIRQAVFWQAVCGTGYLKSYWDPTKLDKDSTETKKQKLQQTSGMNVDNIDANVYGDIAFESISPFYIFVPDLLAENIEDQPYVIHAQVKTLEWVKNTFGVVGDDNKLESVDDTMMTIMGISRNEKKKDQTTVLEVWVKPGYLPDLPNGGMFTIAGGQVVQGFDKWPYDHNEYPFAKLDGTLMGKYYAASVVEDLIPVQRELNRTRAQIIEAKNRMAKPQLVAEEGSINAAAITTEPGQVIFYKIGHTPPQPLPLQNLPSYVTEELNRLYDDMADLSGQHEVSNGSTPPGVTAATAISFLQEQDESLIAANYTSIEEAVEKIGSQALVYVTMFWDEQRTVKVVGLDSAFDVQTFKSADLRGNTDIRCEAGSALPTSRAAKQAFIMDLMKMGFIQPEEGLEIMEIGGLNRIYERVQVDKRQATRENLKMRVITDEDIMRQQEEWNMQPEEKRVDPDSGMALDPPLLVPVNTWDNHQLHIEVHNQYRKSQAFETASSTTRMLFEEHVKQHQEAIMAMMVHPMTGDNEDPDTPPEETDETELSPEEQEMASPTGPEPMPELMEEGE